ncbi:MAG: glycosyltransferase [Anaerolineales bacterium]
MRIAYLTQPYPPMVSGASIFAEQLATGIALRGHQVLVVAASETGRPYTERKQNLTIVRLKSIRNPLRVNQWLMFMQRRPVMQALHDFKPDLIHVHEPVQMGIVGLKYANQAGIPITMTSHQLPWFVSSYVPNILGLQILVEKTVWAYARWLSGKYATIISPTKTISKIIEENTGRMPKTIYYGIEIKNFNPSSPENEALTLRSKLQIPADAPIILHTGRLDKDKRVDQVILASADVLKSSNAHLLIAGDGCEKVHLIKLCKSLGIENQTHFPGFLNKEELAGLYRISSVFVTASEIETQGIVLIEAAACGLPIVAVNATCIPEVVHHGVNGYLSDSGNHSQMASLIENILNNPTFAASMSKASVLIAEKYKIENTFEEHENLYQWMDKESRKPSFLTRMAKTGKKTFIS